MAPGTKCLRPLRYESSVRAIAREKISDTAYFVDPCETKHGICVNTFLLVPIVESICLMVR